MCLDFRECGSKMNKVEDSHQPCDQSEDDHGDNLGYQEGVHNAKTGGEGCWTLDTCLPIYQDTCCCPYGDSRVQTHWARKCKKYGLVFFLPQMIGFLFQFETFPYQIVLHFPYSNTLYRRNKICPRLAKCQKTVYT